MIESLLGQEFLAQQQVVSNLATSRNVLVDQPRKLSVIYMGRALESLIKSLRFEAESGSANNECLRLQSWANQKGLEEEKFVIPGELINARA